MLADVFRKRWKASLVVMLTALAVRVLLAVVLGSYERVNHVELDKVSIALASGQGYSNAFGQRDEPNTGPTAQYPPVFPYLLSLVYGLCGSGVGGEIGKYLFNVLFVCLVYGTLPLIADAFGMPGRAGVYAGLFGAAVPIYLFTELRGNEAPFTGFLLVIATITFRATLLQPSPGWRDAAGHGFLWGLIFSTSASPAPVLVLWLGLLFVTHRSRLGMVFRFATVLTLTVLGMMLPWTVRNYRVLGSPILTRSNLGLELQVSNNDFAATTAYENQSTSPVFDLYHPNRSLEERRRYREIGEVAYNREKMREAVAWIRDHPATFVRLTALRALSFWTAPPRWTASAGRSFQMPMLWAISGLAAFGLWRLLREQWSAGMQFATLWLGFSFIYYLVQFENKYRYPIFWSLLLLASFGLTEISWWRNVERRVLESGARFRKAPRA